MVCLHVPLLGLAGPAAREAERGYVSAGGSALAPTRVLIRFYFLKLWPGGSRSEPRESPGWRGGGAAVGVPRVLERTRDPDLVLAPCLHSNI